MKKCSFCGTENSNDSKYCVSCDKKLPKEITEEVTPKKIQEVPQNKLTDVKTKTEPSLPKEPGSEEKTKVCDVCGAYVTSDKTVCPDCGNFLTDEADIKANEEINRQLEKLSRASDPFYPKMWEKIVGYFSLVGAVVMAVMLLVSIYFEKFNAYYIVSIILFADVYLNAIKIEWMWYLKQLGMAFTVEHPEDMMPSMFWTFGRKAGIILCVAAGVLFSVAALDGLIYKL